MNTILVVLREEDLPAIAWARRITVAGRETLSVGCPRKGQPGLQEVKVAAEETPEMVRASLSAVESFGPPLASVYDCQIHLPRVVG